MGAPGWLSRHAAEVPPGDAWLGEAERTVLSGLRYERRRTDWRLGRYTAKCTVGSWLDIAPERVSVLAAPDGAPEAWIDDEPAPVSLSLSHRDGTSVAVVCGPDTQIGCDLELIEPRSDAFVREWLDEEEQRVLEATPAPQRPLLANVIWSAKEAATKVLREGLRLNVHHAIVSLAPANDNGWDAVRVDWRDGPSAVGWWRVEEPFVIVVLGDQPIRVPRRLPLLAQTPPGPSHPPSRPHPASAPSPRRADRSHGAPARRAYDPDPRP
jgi:4'-phosphopantetheinyl transferase